MRSRAVGPRAGLSDRAGLIAASAALVAVFAAAGAPVALYETYTHHDGISDGGARSAMGRT